MSFAQHEYLPFLVLVLACFQFVPRGARLGFLLAASFVFYLWWEPWHSLLLVCVILLDWGVGLALGAARTRATRRLALGAALAGNLGLLGALKYGAFLVTGLNGLSDLVGLPALAVPRSTVPLGLSFYAFQGLGYVIDVWRGTLPPCRDLTRFALYVAFFPQLVAGPIERATHLLPQLSALERLRVENASEGARLVVWGLSKKWLLADRLRLAVGPCFERAHEQDSASLLVTACALNAVLYLDFSAYTDIARGSARFFGVRLVENFRHPFAARTMAEYARRWHVSLYTWIRDYAFAPLARGSVGHLSLWRNSLLVMGLFGLWHGPSWTFLLWGLAAGCVIAAQQSWRLRRTRAGVRKPSVVSADPRTWRAGDWASWAGTQLATSLFFVLFFAPSVRFAGRYYARLLELVPPEGAALREFVLPIGGFLALALFLHLVSAGFDAEGRWARLPGLARVALLCALVLVILSSRVESPLPFVYFRF